MSTEPNTGLTWQEAGSRTTDSLHNQVVDLLGFWLNCTVLAVGQAAPVGGEAEGTRYIVGTGTGLFAEQDGKGAILRGGTWQFHAPPSGGVPIIRNLDDGADWGCDDSGVWAAKAGGGGGGGSSTIDIVTEGSAFTATVADHAGKDRMVLAGGDVTFDSAESYSAGRAFNIRATAALELIEDGVTLTPPAGGTLELDADMAVTVLMTSGTAGIVIGQTVAA